MTSSGGVQDHEARPDLAGLQYLRAIAASAVALRHINGAMADPKYLGHEPFGGIFQPGNLGVDLFFVISGFIMVYVATNRDGSARVSSGLFLKARFARIIPFLWVVIVGYAALRFAGRGTFDYWPYLHAFVLWPFGEVAPSQVWTLSYELLFYSVFALGLLPWKVAQWLVPVWFVLCAAMGLSGGFESPARGFSGQGLLSFLFAPTNLLFAPGMVAGWLFLRRGRAGSLPAWAGWLLIPAAIAIGWGAWTSGYSRNAPVLVLAGGGVTALLLYAAAGLRSSSHPAARLGKLLGDASYAIYLTHGVFISGVLGVLAKGPRLPDVVVVGGLFALLLAGGVAVHLVLERPVVRFARRLLVDRHRAAA